MGVSIKPKDPRKKVSSRVFRDAADSRLQTQMEGKNTPFQEALRHAERQGKKDFMFNGKKYAARTYAPGPGVKKAMMPPPVMTPPAMRAPTPVPVTPPTAGFPSGDPVEEVNERKQARATRRASKRAVRGRKQVMRNATRVPNITPTGTRRKRGDGF